MGGLIFLVVIIVIVLWVLASCVRIVPQAYAMVVERLGAYKETGTDLHHLLWCIRNDRPSVFPDVWIYQIQ